MSIIEQRLAALGPVLPPPLSPPPGVRAHARSAVGMAELPFDIPVEIEAEVVLVSTRSE